MSNSKAWPVDHVRHILLSFFSIPIVSDTVVADVFPGMTRIHHPAFESIDTFFFVTVVVVVVFFSAAPAVKAPTLIRATAINNPANCLYVFIWFVCFPIFRLGGGKLESNLQH